MSRHKKKKKKKNTFKPKTSREMNTSKIDTKKKEKPIKPSIERFCSFCGHSSLERWRMIAGHKNIFICDNCIEICNAILLNVDDDNTQKVWRQRILDILANPNKFNIETVKKSPKKRLKKNGR
jgi:hypothetical protein